MAKKSSARMMRTLIRVWAGKNKRAAVCVELMVVSEAKAAEAAAASGYSVAMAYRMRRKFNAALAQAA